MITGEELLKDEDGFPLWRVTWEVQSFKVSFLVHEVQSAYEADEAGHFNICEEELRLSGDVKWDGCSNWDYHNDGVLAHFCGVQGVHRFCSMHMWLYAKAADLLVAQGCDYPTNFPDDFIVAQEKPAT